MQEKLTLQQVIPVVAHLLNLTETDAKVTTYINRAIERLIAEGDWVGTTGRYWIVASDGRLTWPREIARITSYAIEDVPGQVRNGWYEFLESGPGIATELSLPYQCINYPDSPAFDDAVDGEKYMIYCEATEAAGSYVILNYEDNSHNPQSQRFDPLPAAGTYSIASEYALAGGLTSVVKSETAGTVRLYAYDPVTDIKRPMAYWYADQTAPSYRRSFVPGLDSLGQTVTITVQAKKAFIPAANDDDVLLLTSLDAIRMGCQAVYWEECGQFDKAEQYLYGLVDQTTGRRTGGAIGILKKQLEDYQGPGIVAPVRVAHPRLFGIGTINAR